MAVDSRGGRDRRGAQRAHWHKHVQAWERSGLTAAGYCRQKGLDPKRFYRWRRVLKSEDEAERCLGEARPESAMDAFFAEVRVSGHAPEGHGGVLEIVVAGERRIRVGPGFDASVLRRVVKVLEELPC